MADQQRRSVVSTSRVRKIAVPGTRGTLSHIKLPHTGDELLLDFAVDRLKPPGSCHRKSKTRSFRYMTSMPPNAPLRRIQNKRQTKLILRIGVLPFIGVQPDCTTHKLSYGTMASADVIAITKWSIFRSSHVGSIPDFGMALFAPPTLCERRHRGLARFYVRQVGLLGAGAAGWYWWPCFPGGLPDGEADGPYETALVAYQAALG
jgi:hypothetical protein